MVTIVEITKKLNGALRQIHSDFEWHEYAHCVRGDKILYGAHVSVHLYYEENKPIKATYLLRKLITNIFKKYYSSKAKFYKANHC